ncbi:ankyrin repeat domain-containing protein [Microbulbifer sp. SA54]|uniref:ankyrin repeat domain-containing protein n=1 Tax=Microbulbifer sp. SA54 TaxID=3401577 RepID=UPI003AB0FD47
MSEIRDESILADLKTAEKHNLLIRVDQLMRTKDGGPEIETLLKQGLNLDWPTNDGRTLLKRLIEKKDHIGIRFLLDLGANVEGVKRSPKPLTAAVIAGDLKSVKLLLERGAKPDREPLKTFMPPLIHAADRGYTDIVAALLAKGCRVSKGPERWALALACLRGHTTICSLLLDAGAPVLHDQSPPKNQSAVPNVMQPIEEALLNEHVDCARLLVERGAEVTQRLMERLVEDGRFVSFRFALDHVKKLDLGEVFARTAASSPAWLYPGKAAIAEYILDTLGYEPTQVILERAYRNALYHREYEVLKVLTDRKLALDEHIKAEMGKSIHGSRHEAENRQYFELIPERV